MRSVFNILATVCCCPLMNEPWATLEAGLAAFEPGFILERERPPQQVRAEIAA